MIRTAAVVETEPQLRRYLQVGALFGRLRTLCYVPEAKRWCCQCTCGEYCLVRAVSLNTGETQSCGCLRREVSRQRATTHGQSRHPLYVVWMAMHQRCTNTTCKSYVNYGGRGIYVISAWQTFAPFLRWAYSTGYAAGLTLDRRDNDGPYAPGNCRWATRQEQAQNRRQRRDTRWVSAFGVTKSVAAWSRDVRCAVSYNNLTQRIFVRGWSPERALSQTVQHHA